MRVTWWILLIVFGYLGLTGLRKYAFSRMSQAEAALMVISVVIAAVAAGMLFG